jgi:hypothetical protein
VAVGLAVPAIAAAAQALTRPAAAPYVTAENERWFVEGEPIMFAGNLYYPAGAQVFFNGNEMVRSGFYIGIPLYTRTTIEPYSVVYVPVAGGLMQPYERPRNRELTGTAGSTPPALLTPYDPASAATLLPQAPAPPSVAPIVIVPEAPLSASRETAPIGMVGRQPAHTPMHTRIGGRPQGINAVFIEYDGRRWYSTGRSMEVDPSHMQRVRDYEGFEVWRDRRKGNRTIYVATTRRGTIVVPYTPTRPHYEGLRSR